MIGDWKLETGDWKLGIGAALTFFGDWKLVIGDWDCPVCCDTKLKSDLIWECLLRYQVEVRFGMGVFVTILLSNHRQTTVKQLSSHRETTVKQL